MCTTKFKIDNFLPPSIVSTSCSTVSAVGSPSSNSSATSARSPSSSIKRSAAGAGVGSCNCLLSLLDDKRGRVYSFSGPSSLAMFLISCADPTLLACGFSMALDAKDLPLALALLAPFDPILARRFSSSAKTVPPFGIASPNESKMVMRGTMALYTDLGVRRMALVLTYLRLVQPLEDFLWDRFVLCREPVSDQNHKSTKRHLKMKNISRHQR